MSFSACIRASFKLKYKYFSHHFYIVYIPENSNFEDILGLDYIYRFNITIDTFNKFIHINNNLPIPLETLDITSKVSDVDGWNSLHDVMTNQDVFLNSKIILEPQQEKRCSVYTNHNSNKDDIKIQDRIFGSKKELIGCDSIVQMNKNSKHKKNTSQIHQLFSFSIKNNSNSTIPLSKHTKNGHLSEVEERLE